MEILEFTRSLSMLQLYFSSLFICLCLSWAVQWTDEYGEKGFPIGVGIAAFIPYINLLIAIAVAITALLFAGLTLIVLPEIIRDWNKKRKYSQDIAK